MRKGDKTKMLKSATSLRKAFMKTTKFVAVCALGLSGLSLTAPASAQNGRFGDGQVYGGYDMGRDYASTSDTLLRPCFGALIHIRQCHGTYHRRGAGYGWNGHASSISVNCDRESPRLMAMRIAHVRTGGTIHLSGKRCKLSLNINRSLFLTGTGTHEGATVLEALDGESCLRVAPGAGKVMVQNLILRSERGGQSACIYSSGSELTMKNVLVRYEGDSAALNSYNGRINLIDSALVARTRQAAWLGTNVQAFVENVVIASTSDGVRASMSGDSSMQGVTLVQLGDWKGFERGENARGLDLKLSAEDAILTLDDFKISDFADGMRLTGGGEALISRFAIEGAAHGIASSLNRVRMIDNVVKASEIGISVFGGTGFLKHNRVAQVRTAGLLAEDDGKIRAVDNQVDTSQEGCASLKWSGIEPAERKCTPWYRGSEFDTPSESDQPMFMHYWPNLEVSDAASGAKSSNSTGPKPYVPSTPATSKPADAAPKA